MQWSPEGTPVSLDFGDIYFQPGAGVSESDYVFLQGNDLPRRFQNPSGGVFRVAELGFGTGLNFLLTAALWAQAAPPEARLFYASIEKHPLTSQDLQRALDIQKEHLRPDLVADLLAQYPPLVEGFHSLRFLNGRVRLLLGFGDVSQVLPELGGRFDAWFLDGFAPAKNPAMWGEALFPLIAARTAPGGTAASFSAASCLRRGLATAGFTVEKTKGFGYKRDMTRAHLPGQRDEAPPGRATVLGAGLAGCAAARALADKGFTVTVIERHATFAAEASGNPAGLLYPKLTVDPSPHGRFHGHGFCYTRTLIEALKPQGWSPCGVLHLDLSPEDRARSVKLVEKNDFPPDYAQAVEEVAPLCGLDLAGSGLFHAGAGVLPPPALCAALLDHPRITLRFSNEITALPREDGPLVVALANAVRGFFPSLPLQPLRGQITALTSTPVTQTLKVALCHDGYVTPALEGLHYCGSTFQKEDVGPPETRPEDDAQNLKALHRHVPAFLGLKHVAGARAGYRATTPDRLPLAGLHDGVYVAAGFGAHGLSGAPLAGEIVASLIAGDPPPVPLSLLPYLAPGRFSARTAKKSGP